MSALRREVRKLAGLAAPVAGAQVGFMLLGTVDTLMVARVSVEALAAAALANAWIFGALLLGQGLIHGIDPIITFGTGLFLGEGLARALSFSVTTVLGGILGFVLMAATFFVLGVTSPGFVGPAASPIPIDPDDD